MRHLILTLTVVALALPLAGCGEKEVPEEKPITRPLKTVVVGGDVVVGASVVVDEASVVVDEASVVVIVAAATRSTSSPVANGMITRTNTRAISPIKTARTRIWRSVIRGTLGRNLARAGRSRAGRWQRAPSITWAIESIVHN